MRRASLLILSIAAASSAWGWEIRGEAALEGRHFPHESLVVNWQSNLSATLKMEVLHDWNGGADYFTFIPFARLDQHDAERTHVDIRELSWIHVSDNWESRVGIRKVFWGVTEGRHLVDIINQTDYVDQIDEEEKLGQPMINLSTVRDWGTLDLYLLPGFRERTFAGQEGRPQIPIPITADRALYESGAEWRRIDTAVRLQSDWGNWQTALSHFSGTTREPVFQVEIEPSAAAQFALTGRLPTGYRPHLIPVYQVIDQTGLELQFLHGEWLLKAEVISRSGQHKRFQAADVGFEYTQTGVLNSKLDIGWIVEYLWDSRETVNASPFEHDWLLGARVSFNDFASTEMLIGALIDPHTEERVLTLESSRRIGTHFTLSLDAQFYLNTGPAPSAEEILHSAALGQRLLKPLSHYATEDLIQVALTYYF